MSGIYRSSIITRENNTGIIIIARKVSLCFLCFLKCLDTIRQKIRHFGILHGMFSSLPLRNVSFYFLIHLSFLYNFYNLSFIDEKANSQFAMICSSSNFVLKTIFFACFRSLKTSNLEDDISFCWLKQKEPQHFSGPRRPFGYFARVAFVSVHDAGFTFMSPAKVECQ